MKIIDCITYFDEPMLFDIRLNVLNDYVDTFLVIEAKFTHSGKNKKLNFDIKNYKKFEDKIKYLVIDREPSGIIYKPNLSSSEKRINSLKRIEQSYNKSLEFLDKCDKDDLFLLSDSDEVPNLEKINFKNIKNEIIFFKQKMFYYKFNLFYDRLPWFGTKAVKVKNLINPAYLRYAKAKKYPVWRPDVWFSRIKHYNAKFINDGGWHFTKVKSAEKIYENLMNFGHHNEYEDIGLKISDIANMIEYKYVNYDHFADQKSSDKISIKSGYNLKKIPLDELPFYISNNIDKFQDFLEL